MSEQATLSMGGAFVDDSAARTEFLAVQRRLRWRKRLLPLAAVLALCSLVASRSRSSASGRSSRRRRWRSASVVSRFDMLMRTCCRPRSRRVLGFLLGNFAGMPSPRRSLQPHHGGGFLSVRS